MPALPPSTSRLNQYSNNNKRRYDDEAESDSEDMVDKNPDFAFSFPANLSPSANGYPISHTSMPDLAAISTSRPIVRPRTRRKGVAQGVVQDIGIPDMDFEDASFLIPADEVEMGGT